MNKNKIKKKFTRKGKAIFLLVFLLSFLLVIFLYLTNVVNPVILQATEAKIKSLTQKALSSAVYSVISNNNFYSNLISYTYDKNGKIAMINTNGLEVNSLARNISAMAQGTIDNMTNAGIEVKLGAFSGIMVLANFGPTITMNLSPIGSVSTYFRSEFKSAGINQTNHRIFISLDSTVSIILPTASPQIKAGTEVLVAESVIIGEIPSTYLQSSYLDEMLNLVPS